VSVPVLSFRRQLLFGLSGGDSRLCSEAYLGSPGPSRQVPVSLCLSPRALNGGCGSLPPRVIARARAVRWEKPPVQGRAALPSAGLVRERSCRSHNFEEVPVGWCRFLLWARERRRFPEACLAAEQKVRPQFSPCPWEAVYPDWDGDLPCCGSGGPERVPGTVGAQPPTDRKHPTAAARGHQHVRRAQLSAERYRQAGGGSPKRFPRLGACGGMRPWLWCCPHAWWEGLLVRLKDPNQERAEFWKPPSLWKFGVLSVPFPSGV
ncbi:uncharacterized protein LOC112543036, partial [Python bivittatus]|uniref:Uncharacterized protein LOC112543036 n=1 Tax=Python bivittatus TaxID=176946 RepID=A0A9F5J981_PYTBI